ncbi:DUF971 domain-containing protein [Luteolibacter pohnpeiensis]|uniref:DUF971 domain-containing protein n=1 Tax=Luteolibacter pohnpeiensis TaxID=454153 RepID=A0A934S465_9BACT|nr:DUF971 domain-containing protein [Luteolibacter pohnpeiensis]MBK1881593.1 DUF971 domain-containing protein [Luteolibacter pohnpeiensis]
MQLEQAVVIGEEFALSFSDATEVYLPLAMLRRACPCAKCQGEPDALGRVVRPLVEHGPGAFEMSHYQVIGGYAIQPFWKDGHSSGIYSYEYLLRLAGLGDE